LQHYHANAKLSILWSIVVLPWPISILSVGLLTFPKFSQTREAWLSSFTHWHHIYNFEILSWHGASTWIFSLIFIGVCITKIHKAFKASAKLSQLDFFVENTTGKQGLIVLKLVQCQAFTSGFVRPRSYITSGLLDQLTQQEASVVAAHQLSFERRQRAVISDSVILLICRIDNRNMHAVR
jgi:Zn-dependent protease with chaperone function